MKKINKIKSIILFQVMMVLLFLTACDTNDDNDPMVDCDAKFYTMASTHWDTSTAVYDIFEYQKSAFANTPNALSTGNSYNISSGILGLMGSAINTNLGKIVYNFSGQSDLYIFDINTNSISVGTIPGGNHPEYLGNNLYFIRIENSSVSGNFLQSGNCKLVDINNTAISQSGNLNFANSGLRSPQEIVSTSNYSDKIYYLANTKLIVYNNTNNTWTNYDLEIYNDTSNKVIYKGLEYIDDNTLYALQGDYTDPVNATLKLIKIDLSNSIPQVNVLKNLTGQLSVSALAVINGNITVTSAYDDCDDSYYFTYGEMGNINAIIFEVKLVSNVINEYPVNGRLLYGLDIKN